MAARSNYSKQSYNDQEKATALLFLETNDGNIVRTSKQTGVPQQTLRQWRDGLHVNTAIAEIKEIKREEMHLRMEETMHLLIDAIPGKIEDAKLSEVSLALAQITDKRQLLTGNATSINETRPGSVEERDAKLMEIVRQGHLRLEKTG